MIYEFRAKNFLLTMEEKPIVFIYAILALLILVRIRRSFKMIFRTHLIEIFRYFSEVKTLKSVIRTTVFNLVVTKSWILFQTSSFSRKWNIMKKSFPRFEKLLMISPMLGSWKMHVILLFSWVNGRWKQPRLISNLRTILLQVLTWFMHANNCRWWPPR